LGRGLSLGKIIELYALALKALPPGFLGLVPWKYKSPVSAFYHSLSVASIAYEVSRILTDEEFEQELAAYTGLFHDYYQKCRTIGWTADKAREKVYDLLDSDRELAKLVDEAENYNVAENPKIWAGRHPVASLAVWLADRIASFDGTIYTLQSEVASWALDKRLDDAQRKMLEELKTLAVSITAPQTFLRSALYYLVYEKLRKELKPAVIAAPGGLLVITRAGMLPGSISISKGELLSLLEVGPRLLEEIYGGLKPKPRKGEFYSRLGVDESGDIEIVLGEGARAYFTNVQLSGVKFVDERETVKCIFCGTPTKSASHPTARGYIVFGKSSAERWSPRLGAILHYGKNLNRLMQEDLKKLVELGVAVCPLCTLDAIAIRMSLGKMKNAKGQPYYVIQYHMVKPTARE
jgi:HD superfamily phosphodiesterase